MGVLNVTPDSFSDGGQWLDAGAALRQGLRLIEEGADVVDVGGESTRPGATPVPEAEELRRVLPVIEAMAMRGVRVSIDTRKAAVARAAANAGATIINDVSASLWPIAAELGTGWIAMHMPADPSVMQSHARYDDVVAEVREYLVEHARRARSAGVSEVWVDPGIGFGKTGHHNLLLLRHLDALVGCGFPVVIGASRKSFLGRLTPGPDGTPAPPLDRLEASIATAAWAILQGVDMVRVHDVAPAVQAVRLAQAAAPTGTSGRAVSIDPAAGAPADHVAAGPSPAFTTGDTGRPAMNRPAMNKFVISAPGGPRR
jgi:dihydropteroate synthase